MPRLAGLLIAVLAVAAVGYIVASGSEEDRSGEPAVPAAGAAAAEVQATCTTGVPSSAQVSPKSVVLGQLVLIGARYAEARRPDAFAGHGYKIPVSLPESGAATLSVARAARGHVGLVFTLDTQDRVEARGVDGADRSVRFTACPDEAGNGGRTGWPGGFVVDHGRCATLLLTVAGRAAVRHRVPLGRRC